MSPSLQGKARQVVRGQLSRGREGFFPKLALAGIEGEQAEKGSRTEHRRAYGGDQGSGYARNLSMGHAFVLWRLDKEGFVIIVPGTITGEAR